MPKKVQVINPASGRLHDKLPVAAYCRVSSNSDDQRNSFAAQVKAYTEEIGKNPDWTLAGIYADKGITGTSVKKRSEFNRLMEDGRQGKVKRILVKSVSRFARNTKECLEYVRELKLLGVSVYFEDKKIDTAHYSSEMLLAMLGSVAQEESVSISNNMRWSYEKRMKNGEFITNTPPYGYRLIKGTLVINEPEATIVRRIFSSYLNGVGTVDIAKTLNSQGIYRNQRPWSEDTIKKILANEKYMGDALLRKYPYYGPALLKANQVTQAQYYVTNCHDPIIDRDTYSKARMLSNRRKPPTLSHIEDTPLRKYISCVVCGSTFKLRKNKRGENLWVCSFHDANRLACPTPPISESMIECAFLRMFGLLLAHKDAILTPMLHQLRLLRDKSVIGSADINALNEAIVKLSNQIHALNHLRTKGFLEPTVFQERLNELTAQLSEAQSKRELLISGQAEDQTLERTEELIEIIEHAPAGLASLEDGEVFSMMVDKVLVDKNKKIVFRLINGMELMGDGGKLDGEK